MDEIGLFPLPLVLMPGEQAPLHIFEPRYRELVAECLDRAEPFGLVLSDEEGGIREVGTRALVVEVLDRFDDGRLNIVVEGVERFRVVGLTDGRPFVTAEVDAVDDDLELPTPGERADALAAYDRVVEAAEAELDDLEREGDDLAFQIAARIDLGTEVKQQLLEMRSERERIVALAGLLDRAAEAVARDREVRHRASGNGRVEAL
jgi:Lon protease-like protein